MKFREREVVAAVQRLYLRDLRAWVREGWIRPVQAESGPLFDDIDIARIRLICDLKYEMSLPLDAVPTILSLVDQVHGLRSELRLLGRAIERQPEPTRKAVLEAYRYGTRDVP